MLVLTFLFMLAVVSVSTGLVVYTASHHDLVDGSFALAFAVLNGRVAFSWFLWRNSNQQPVANYQQSRDGRKLAAETSR